MSTLTGQEVVSQLATRLRARFSKDEIVEIYKDKPAQSAKTPYIFIHQLEAAHTPQMRGYARWDFPLDIRCHPDKMRTNIHTWGRHLAVQIIDVVKELTISNQAVKASTISWRVEDGVLHVLVNYGFRVIEVRDSAPDMNTLTYGERIKE